MYNVVNDSGNVYVYDADDNLINFKDTDIIEAIKLDNSIITGEDMVSVSQIVEYCNNFSDIQPELKIPDYLLESEIEKTSLANDND